MNQSSVRENDNIELALFFLLRHWKLLVTLSVLGAALGFAATLKTPITYSAVLSISAPTYTMPEFDRLMLSAPDNPYADRLYHTASGLDRDAVQASVSKVLAELSATANTGLEREKARHAELLRVRAGITENGFASTANPAELANALTANLNALDIAEHRISTIERWRDQFPEDAVITQSSRGNGVYFGMFSGFTLALLIALALSVLRGRKTS